MLISPDEDVIGIADCQIITAGGVTRNGRREVGQNRHWEVGGSRILNYGVGSLDLQSVKGCERICF